MRSETKYWVGSLTAAVVIATLGCATRPLDSTDTDCQEVGCESELILTLEDAQEGFSLTLYGEDLPTMMIACPEGVSSGGSLECTEEGVRVTYSSAFPETLTVTVDSEPEQEIQPEWEEFGSCGVTCNLGSYGL